MVVLERLGAGVVVGSEDDAGTSARNASAIAAARALRSSRRTRDFERAAAMPVSGSAKFYSADATTFSL